jgi:twitching motility two-component system response regulator PilG
MSQAQSLNLLKDGIAAAKAGDKVQARLLLQQATDLDPHGEAGWLWLAGVAASPLETVHFLERVLALNPGHDKASVAIRTARVQAGIAAAKAQDKVQAHALLQRALEHDPDNEMAWIWLASVAETPQEAVRCLDKVLELNPANDRARVGLERYRSQLAALAAPEGPATRACATRPGAGPTVSAAQAPEAPRVRQLAPAPLDLAPDLHGDNEQTEILDEPVWLCPFCATSGDERPDRCPECGGVQTLVNPEVFFRPLPIVHDIVAAAVDRLEKGTSPADFAGCYQLGLGYLHLRDFDAAIHLFQVAAEMRPEDDAFAAQLGDLIQCKKASDSKLREARQVRRTVLIVDDSPTIRKQVTMTLERRGYQVRAVADGGEVLNAIRQWGLPDLLLLDVTLPDMDGYQLCKMLRQDADAAHLPIILLTGKDGLLNKVRGRMAGATEHLTKPFEPETLVQAVERNCPAADAPLAGSRR